MAIPAVIGLISKILGGMSAAKGLSSGGGQTTDQMQLNRKRVPVGNITGTAQAPGTATTRSDQFMNGANKAMTIANLLSSLRGQGSAVQPYQMQFNRRN